MWRWTRRLLRLSARRARLQPRSMMRRLWKRFAWSGWGASRAGSTKFPAGGSNQLLPDAKKALGVRFNALKEVVEGLLDAALGGGRAMQR